MTIRRTGLHARKIARFGGLGLFAIGLAALAFAGPPDSAASEFRLPHIFSDHMVLQRELKIPVWGWSAPGAALKVQFAGQAAQAQADAQGKWRVDLPAQPAGGPHELVVSDGAQTLTLHDILVGEVWLCSGQSNMEMGVGVVKDGDKEAAAADYPRIRLFDVQRQPSAAPLTDTTGAWRACSPKTIADYGWGGFSAVGYFFGRELHRELDVPVGLIDSTWGGTAIEPWTPAEAFGTLPALAPVLEGMRKAAQEYRGHLPESMAKIDAWLAATRAALQAGGELPATPDWPRDPLASERQPAGLYNGMISPIVPFALRGAIWYQGENNAMEGDGLAYLDKMKALIGGWRTVWGAGEFPFYYVQIAPFRYTLFRRNISPAAVPLLWEAQRAALAIPNTGMVVTTDISNLTDIHPANKQEVGRRLALWALVKTYGRQDRVYSGPLYKSIAVEGGKIRVSFDHADGLRTNDDKPPTFFQIAGADRKFVPAEARIDGATVLVSSAEVAAPVAVRFGWNMEAEPNLTNGAKLPASPFRSDDWNE
jgi:sialate O-acetylesterase